MRKRITQGLIIELCAIVLTLFPLAASKHWTAFADTKDRDLALTIVYDNNPYDGALETRWGFSCYIKGAEKTVLFDVGGEGSVLMDNMAKLGIDPRSVDAVVLSHVHYDHVGGLPHFLSAHPCVAVYMPRSLPQSLKDTVRKAGSRLVEVHEPMEICKDVYSTGELGDFIKEESLVIRTTRGLIVITGCAHPGIVNTVERAKEMFNSDVYLVLGGFHLSSMDASQIERVVLGIKKSGCKMVAPCHCSGDLARSEFKKAYGKDFILVGAGKTVILHDAF